MDVLVAVASRHGATLQIGEAIAATLATHGLRVETRRVEDVRSLDGHDAVILGSAIYAGHWLRRARVFVDTFEADLLRGPLWLFSSGPVGDPPRPAEVPTEVARTVRRLGAQDHQLFGGHIDGDVLNLAEKALVALVRAPYGDYRPWERITAWAEAIAADLRAGATAAG